MGLQAIPTRVDFDGTNQTEATITAEWYNVFTGVLAQNLVPRDAEAAPLHEAANLGTEAIPFRGLQEFTGGYSRGDIKLHQTFNGLVTAGGGWMLCDGRVVSKENYEAEHGAGTWDIDVGSTPLEGLYLPDYCAGPAGRGRALLGAAETSHDGLAAFPAVGNPDHRVDLSHNHQWSSDGQTWIRNSFDVPATFQLEGWRTEILGAGQYGFAAGNVSFNAWTEESLSQVYGVKPHTNPTQVYMRII